MARSQFTLRLQALREQAGLSQSKLAQLAGLSHSCVSSLEAGTRRPSHGTIEKLARALGMSREELLGDIPCHPRKRGPQRLRKHRAALQRLLPRCRPARVACTLRQAFKAACERCKLGVTLVERVEKGGRRPTGFWTALKHLAEILNSPEQLFVLHMLDAGADLEDLVPWDIGFERPLVCSPLRRWLALVLLVDGVYRVMFPQAGVTTRPGRYRTLDVLVAVVASDCSVWVDSEIDGPGHEGRKAQDAKRDEEVALKVMRIPVREVERPDFAARFVRSTLGRLPQTAGKRPGSRRRVA